MSDEAPQDKMTGSDPSTGDRRVKEHVAISYVRANVAAFLMAGALFALSRFGTTDGTSGLLQRVVMGYAGLTIFLTFAPLFILSARVLNDVMRIVRVPTGPGWILIGGIQGSVLLFTDLQTGRTPEAMAYCMVAAGFFGGYWFWRRRGFPGLTSEQRRTMSIIDIFVRRGERQLR